MEAHPVLQTELAHEILAGRAVVAVAQHVEHHVEVAQLRHGSDHVAQSLGAHDASHVEQPDGA